MSVPSSAIELRALILEVEYAALVVSVPGNCLDRGGIGVWRYSRSSRRHRENFVLRVPGYLASGVLPGAAGCLELQDNRGVSNETVSLEVRALRQDIGREFGFVSRAYAKLLGPFLFWSSIREDHRLARGMTREPKTIIERRNWADVEA